MKIINIKYIKNEYLIWKNTLFFFVEWCIMRL